MATMPPMYYPSHNGHSVAMNGAPINGHLNGHVEANGHAMPPVIDDEPVTGLSMNGLVALRVDSNIDVKEFWRKYDIQVLGKDPPLPILSMEGYKWPHKIHDALIEDKFTSPTPIQCQSWPIALSGRDLVGVAQTGSGKTLCYVLPAFVKIWKDRPQRGPKCLILAPTRELAQQIQSVVRRYRFANNVCLYGGASRGPQIRQIRELNPQIVIATPGRLNDFLESRAIDLRAVDYLVLDEADRMLDMGFEPQLKKIIAMLPRERQTLMWSATWPKEVRQLAAQYMKDYIQINVGGVELTANKNIKQHVEICEEFEKKQKLFDLLTKLRADARENKTIIFAETKRKVNDLSGELRASGWPSACIHGDKPQQERDWVLKGMSLNLWLDLNLLMACFIFEQSSEMVVRLFWWPQTWLPADWVSGCALSYSYIANDSTIDRRIAEQLY